MKIKSDSPGRSVNTAENVPDRRQKILAAAEAVFDANGYATATVEQVAAKAGISKGSIYNYFRSKEELFEQVFANAVSQLEAQALQILAEQVSPDQKLSHFLDYRFRCIEETSRFGRLVLEAWVTASRDQQSELAKRFSEISDRWQRWIAGILAEGAAQGQFALQFDSPVGAGLILALLDGMEIESILGFGPKLDEKYRQAMNTAVLAALRAPKEEPSQPS